MNCIVCPICRQALTRQTPSWRCANGHSFDVAREGYVNLLPVQQKHSAEPGDSADSLRSRRAFLDAGHYTPLREAVVATLEDARAQSLLDIGCGEGYYTAAMSAAVPDVIGLDIAKPAIQLAARRYRGPTTWLVASGAQLPLSDIALDAITCLFTQLHAREMQRVLKPGGLLLVVTPAADHLWHLREGLFDTVQPHEPDKFVETLSEGFELQNTQTLRFDLDLNAVDLANLLSMTPYAWKARPEKRGALARRSGLRTTAAFSLLGLKRRLVPSAAPNQTSTT